MHNKIDEKQMSRNQSQCFWQNCGKLAEWSGIYKEKSQTKTSANIRTEENEAKGKQLWSVDY